MATIHVPLSRPELPDDEGLRMFDETVADPTHNIIRGNAWAALTKRRPTHRLEMPWAGDVEARNPRPRDEAHVTRLITASPWAYRWAARVTYQATKTVTESADVGRPKASITLRIKDSADVVLDAIHWRVEDGTLPTGIELHGRPTNRPNAEGAAGLTFPLFTVDTGSSSAVNAGVALPHKPRLLKAAAGAGQYAEIVVVSGSIHILELFEVPYRVIEQ